MCDDFNKTHGSHSVIYRDSHTHTQLKSLTVQPLLYLSLKFAWIKPVKTSVKIRIIWQKERIPNEINFDELYLNNHVINVKSKFTECRSRFFWEKLQTYLCYSVDFWMAIIQEKAYLLKPHLQTKARLTWIPSYKQIFILRLKLLEIICLPGMLFQFTEETLSCMVVLLYFMLEYCKS